MREILLVVGEASGDLHAGAVAAQLRTLRSDLVLVGVGGGHMAAAGVQLLQDYRELAVMGFTEVLKHVPKHAVLLHRLRRRVRGGNVAAVVLVDYPGFNMKVARAAREAGVPVLYYITPQVWAWGAGRLPKLARDVTKAAVILPFEAPLLREHGIDTTFVGHPLLDRAERLPSREEARARLGVAPDEELLALFPGSRDQEIARHLDDFVATAQELSRRRPGLRVLLGAAPTVQIDRGRCPYAIVADASFALMRAADVALCKSGTTTLEAAIAECPMAIGYRTGALSYRIARRVVRIPHIGLVNVVAGRGIVPEFVQNALSPPRVADALERLLTDKTARATMIAGLREVRASLGTPGAAARTAALVSALAG